MNVDFAYVEKYEIKSINKECFVLILYLVDESADADSVDNNLTEVKIGVKIDNTSKSGLSGLPKSLNKNLIKSFEKDEIMEDPEKVITAYIEGEIMKYGNSKF